MLWRIRLLGDFVLEGSRRETRRFRYQKAASLLAYLVLKRGRAVSREVLMELLWPDEDPEATRNRLRVLLTSLRHHLEPPGVAAGSVLVSHGNGLLQLNPDAFQTDVAAFEAAVRRGEYAEALSLYHGELLPGFYDDWLLPDRNRLATLAEQAQERLADVSVRSAPLLPEPSGKRWLEPTFPSPLTRFFGRDTEIQEISQRLMTFRLVTLIGTGGTGKTRLALEVGNRLRAAFPEGIFFVSLEETFDPAQIIERIRATLRQSTAPETGDIFSPLVPYLGGRRILLILDNFEQLVAPGGGRLVERFLTHLPTLHCLVTSRRPLLIEGEREYTVAPLPLPSPASAASEIAELACSPSVALFLDRATAIRPDFILTPKNAEAIVAICQTLEGLPLAIELAASRLRALSPAQIQNSLTKRFDLLARTERWAEKDRRHSSLRLALEWGWHLLLPAQQQFFARLSVFRGGWTAETAEQVTDTPQAQIALESLVADSLVRNEIRGETTRFRMLETLREFATEHLPPEERMPLTRRHAEYFRDCIEHWDALRFHAVVSSLPLWLEKVMPEMDNLRAAQTYFHADPDGGESEARLVGAATFLWLHLGLTREGEVLVAAAEARYREPTPVRAFLLYRGSWLAQVRGDLAAARRRAAECLALYEAAGDPIGLSFGWNAVSNIASSDGNLTEARRALEKAIAFGKQARHPDFPDSGSYRAIPAANLGELLLAQGEFDAAHDLLTELLTTEREHGVRHGSGIFRNYIKATQGVGRGAEARELWRDFLREAFPADNHFGVIEALEELAQFAAADGFAEHANLFRAAVQSLRRNTDAPGIAALPPAEAQQLREAIRLALS